MLYPQRCIGRSNVINVIAESIKRRTTLKHSLLSRSRPIGLLLALYLIAALALAGCGAIAPTSAPPISAAHVSVQLNWTYTIDWSGFYVAEAKGDYTDQDLTLKLLSGGYDAQGNYVDPVKTVLDGHADFGIMPGSDLLLARERNVPLVAVATNYQRHPLAFTSLAEKQITRPQDLIGKTVQVYPANSLLFNPLLAAQGINPTKVKVVERTDFTTAPLTKGQADVIDAWITNEVPALKLEGRAINTLLPVDYGIEEYPNVIFTTEELIGEHPDLVERFLRATLRGMQSAIDDPKSVAPLAKKYNSTSTLRNRPRRCFRPCPS